MSVTDIREASVFNLQIYEASGLRNFFVNYAPIPPFTLLSFLPLTFVKFETAKLIFNLCGASLFVFSLTRLISYLQLSPLLLLLCIPALFLPIQSNINQGQLYLLVFSFTSEGFLAWQRGAKLIPAIYWSICILLKIFPAIIVLFLLLEKDFRTIFRMLLTGIVLCSLTILITGWESWYTYHFLTLPRLFAGEINDSFAYQYQSMQVLLRNIFVPDQMHNPDALVNNPEIYEWLNRAFKAVVCCITLGATFSKNSTRIQRLSLWIITGLLINGYGTTYGLCIMALPLAAFGFSSNNKPIILFIWLVVALCNIPVNKVNSMPLGFQYPRLYILLIVWILCVVKLKPIWRWWQLWLSAFFLFPMLWYKTPSEDSYYLQKEEALLIYDFSLTKNQINLTYFNQNGPQQKTIYTTEEFKSIEPYPCDRNHLGTEERKSENILKAVRADNRIIYLTDKGRGPGFYTLRYKQLP